MKKIILNEKINFNLRKKGEISEQCITFIKDLLEKDPTKRVDYKKIENLPFFKEKANSILDTSKLIQLVINRNNKSEPINDKGYDSDQTIVNILYY